MPPTDHSPDSKVRYLTRLLAALCLQGGGSIVIDKAYLRQIEEELSRQALFEDSSEDDAIVLRYGSKRAAIYPVEPECQTPKPTPLQPLSVPQPLAQPVQQRTRPPISEMSPSQLAAAERKLRQVRMAAQAKVEQRARQEVPMEDIEEIIGRAR